MVRNFLLRMSAAASVALVAGLVIVGTGSSATATQGEAVLAGKTNTETTATVLGNTSGAEDCTGWGSTDGLVGCGTRGLRGIGTTYGVGAVGGTYGLYGTGTTYGVYGAGSTGVAGNGNTTGVSGVGSDFGVSGSGSTGVYGSGSTGVYGSGSPGVHGFGVPAVFAESAEPDGTAMEVRGKVVLSRSGIATVKASGFKVRVSPIPLSSQSMVLATIQGNIAGTWVQGVTTNVGTNSFTIFLNQVVATNTKIAWFVLN